MIRIIRLGAAVLSVLPLAEGCQRGTQMAPDLPIELAPEKPTELHLHMFVHSAVAQANSRAKRWDEKVIYQRKHVRRTVYFAPAPKEAQGSDSSGTRSFTPSGTTAPAARKSWVDKYVQARKVRCRYELVSIGPVSPIGDGEGWEAQAVVRVRARQRVGRAAEEKAPPSPPEEMRYCKAPSRFHGQGSAGAGYTCSLPEPEVPHEAEFLGPLAQEALRAMLEAPEEKLQETIELGAVYTRRRRCWMLHADADDGLNLDFDTGGRQVKGLPVRSEIISPGETD